MANFSGKTKPADPQSFYTLKDFYSFIRTPAHAPVAHKHNVVQLYIKPQFNTSGELINKSILNDLFSATNCRTFSLSVQSIKTPNITIGNGVTHDTPVGHWSSPDNSPLTAQSYSVDITFLESATPIIENMIYPWMMGVLQTESSVLGSARATNAGIDKSYPYPFPRVDMAIKYFSPFYIPTTRQVLSQEIYPPINWIYYFDGIYPTQIETVKVDHNESNAGSFSRVATFGFNYMLPLISRKHAEQHGLEHLWPQQQDRETANNNV